MSSAVSATAERTITTSGVTHAPNMLIALVSGSAPPRPDAEELHATETAKPGDTDNGKQVAASRADNQRGAKRLRGPATATAVRNPSMQDMLKQKWGAGGRGAGQPTPPDSSSRKIPAADAVPKPPATAQATTTVTSGKGKAKLEEEPTTTDNAKHESADAPDTSIAPAPSATATGQHGPSTGASVVLIPAAVEPKTEKRGRGAKKQPLPSPVVTIDTDDADAELEDLVMIGEIGGVIGGETGTKRRGCGICDPPRGGPGKVSEPHLGGKKRWLGHGPLEDMQYLTAVALMPYDQKVDLGLKRSSKQLRQWGPDLSAAAHLHTSLFITTWLRNLTTTKDKWDRMFKAFRGLTQPPTSITNEIAWAAVVGKEAASEEADIGDVDPTD
ncbi:unnamed protein product [Closterium sp. NIES-54]